MSHVAANTLGKVIFFGGLSTVYSPDSGVTPQASTPTFSPAAGSYGSAQTVTISCATGGVAIHYTTDGTTPTSGSATYSGPITVSSSETVQAIAVLSGYTNSAVGSAAYTITSGATLVFSYPSGFASTGGNINVLTGYGQLSGSTAQLIKANQGHSDGAMWYQSKIDFSAGFVSSFTFNVSGASPTAGALGTACGITFVLQNDPRGNNISGDANSCGYGGYEQYSGNIPISNSIGVKFADLSGAGYYANTPTGYNNTAGLFVAGGFADALWPCQDINPYGINVSAGNVIAVTLVYDTSILTMTMTDTMTNAQARFSWPVNISAFCGATTAYMGISAGEVANYVISVYSWTHYAGYNTRLATPTFSVTPGKYTTTQTVAISGPSGSTIYYTTNGLEPSSSSTVYSGSLTVSANTIIKAIAIKSGYTDSLVATGNYQIQSLAAPTINFPSGFASYAGLLNLVGRTTLATSSLKLTDGTNPTGSGEVGAFWYPAPVTVSGTWSTSFQFNLNAGSARGIAFVIQNQPTPSQAAASGLVGITGGPFAFGHGDFSIGYAGLGVANSGGSLTPQENYGLSPSVAVIFATIGGSGSFTGVYTGATAIPASGDGTSINIGSTLNFQSGHSFNAVLSYNGTALSISVTDATTSANYSTSVTLNIPTAAGGSTAYVGFTASDYGGGAQQINNWTGF